MGPTLHSYSQIGLFDLNGATRPTPTAQPAPAPNKEGHCSVQPTPSLADYQIRIIPFSMAGGLCEIVVYENLTKGAKKSQVAWVF